jgi:hypothetical protein
MEGLQNLVELLIPISAIVLGIGVAFWSIYWDHQKKRLQYQERQLMIEKGLTPPPMISEKSKKTPEDSLRRGIVQLFLGLGFTIGAVVLANFGEEQDLVWIAGVTAAIVGSLGLGNLVYYFIARRKPADTVRTP